MCSKNFSSKSLKKPVKKLGFFKLQTSNLKLYKQKFLSRIFFLIMGKSFTSSFLQSLHHRLGCLLSMLWSKKYRCSHSPSQIFFVSQPWLPTFLKTFKKFLATLVYTLSPRIFPTLQRG